VKRIGLLIDQNLHGTTLLFVDLQNAKEILPYIFQETVDNEFKAIRNMLKGNLRNEERYRKVNVSGKADNMFEMRFIKNGKNDRIYCQEVRKGRKRIIVLVELFTGKKSQEIPKKIKLQIEVIGGYEYEFQF
jgi:hypothetical protein